MSTFWKDAILSAAVQKGETRIVPWIVCREAALEAGIPPRQAEIWACENGICPSRYERSIGTLGLDGQARLLSSRAAVIGCGGLGGWIVEILARAGVGEMVVVMGTCSRTITSTGSSFVTRTASGNPRRRPQRLELRP